MEQDTTAAIPVIDNSKQKDGKGWKIAMAIMFVVAICGIGFGVYGMIQGLQKDNQISDLKAQADNDKATTAIDTSDDETTNADQLAKTLVETAIDEEKSIAWPADIERTEDEPELLVNKIVLPKIATSSEAAQSINTKIVEKYSKYLADEQTFSKGPFEITTSYDSVMRDDILYLVIRFAAHSYRATGSSGFDVYYYDIKNDAELSVKDVAAMYNIPQNATIIVPSVADSFDYYYHDDKYCYRMGCEVIDNTF